MEEPWIVGSVYLPRARLGTVPVAKVVSQVQRLRTQFPGTPIAVMGDWNRTEQQVEAILKGIDSRARVLRTAGAEGVGTTRYRRSGRKIDHIAVVTVGRAKAKLPRILLDADISDHFPVVGSIGGRTGRPPGHTQRGEAKRKARPGIDIRRIPVVGGPADKDGTAADLAKEVAESNRWSALLELESTDLGEPDPEEPQAVCNAAAEKGIRTCHEVEQQNGMARPEGTGRPRPPKQSRANFDE